MDDLKRALRERIKRLVIEVCEVPDVTPDMVGDDTILFGTEPVNLSSLDAVEIAVALEHEFKIEVKNASSVRDHFKSAATMADFVLANADPTVLKKALEPNP